MDSLLALDRSHDGSLIAEVKRGPLGHVRSAVVDIVDELHVPAEGDGAVGGFGLALGEEELAAMEAALALGVGLDRAAQAARSQVLLSQQDGDVIP